VGGGSERAPPAASVRPARASVAYESECPTIVTRVFGYWPLDLLNVYSPARTSLRQASACGLEGLGEQVVCVSVTAKVPADYGKIASLKTHRQ